MNILKAPQLKNWSAYFFCITMSSFNGSAFVYIYYYIHELNYDDS